MSTIPLDLELCPAPKETEEEENETDDSSEEDLGEHIDDATLKQWMENQFESEDEMSQQSEKQGLEQRIWFSRFFRVEVPLYRDRPLVEKLDSFANY